MLDIYAQNILDHYKDPHNHRKMIQPSSKAHDSNPICGDEITIYLRLNGSKVVDASFTGKGCAVSVASASMLTDSLKGLQKGAALRLNRDSVMKMLGVNITPARIKC